MIVSQHANVNSSVKKKHLLGAVLSCARATMPGLTETRCLSRCVLLFDKLTVYLLQFNIFSVLRRACVSPETVPVVSQVLGRPSQARPHQQPRPSRADC